MLFLSYRFVDLKCSGLRHCRFMVSEAVHKGIRPCPVELQGYLEAQYSCISGRVYIVEYLQSFVTHVQD